MLDLHMHTRYSDGSDEVSMVLEKAEKLKLKCIAITDHNTCLEYNELKNENIRSLFSGKIIPGVELNTKVLGIPIEILGYNVDTDLLQKYIDETYMSNEERCKLEVERLYNKCISEGILLPEDFVEKYDGSMYASKYLHSLITKDENNKQTSFHYPDLKPEINTYQVLKDLFSDLPERKAGEGKLCEPIAYTKSLSEMPYLKKANIRTTLNFTTQHIARPHNENDREIYKMAIEKWLNNKERLNYSKLPSRLQHHKNKKSFLNRFNVVDPFGYSHTVVAHIAMDGHYYIYPTLNPTIENVRSITIREAARLQSFPDDYYFEGSRSAAFKQIGNAVPVVLAYKIAKELQKQF